MDRTQDVFLWMAFLLATNTGIVLTLLRERIVFRTFRDELGRLLPPGYDPNRLDYPYLFDFLTPPAWREALRQHTERMSVHPARDRWLTFRRIRTVLMGVEGLLVVAFVVWAVMGGF
ncbi:MAG: hypothetical protein OHK0021_13530 [Bryobacter sp.]